MGKLVGLYAIEGDILAKNEKKILIFHLKIQYSYLIMVSYLIVDINMFQTVFLLLKCPYMSVKTLPSKSRKTK
jgi:hypothetical protein